ncbi:MAG: type II secretion system protein [Phycisphaerales bacterium JB059]
MTVHPKVGADASRSSAGFSLAELLIVIAIIALLVAITIPALGGARTAARKASTSQLISSFTQASASFGNDNSGRAPGLFSVADMGHSENEDEGMSAMENAILDLAGQDAILGRFDQISTPTNNNAVLVGPRSDQNTKYWVDPTLIGTGSSYFELSPEYYVAQLRGAQQVQTPMEPVGHAADDEEDPQLRDVVDAWGQPLLLWVEDEFGPARIDQNASDIAAERLKFAAMGSDTGGGSEFANSHFYWMSNAAFLQATELGKKGFNMDADPMDEETSIIGSGVRAAAGDDHIVESLAALLGNPGFTQLQDSGGTFYNPEDLLPGSSRGKIVVHSAGADGIYLSTKDKGLANATDDGDHIVYGTNFYTPGAATGDPDLRYKDDDGAPTSLDVIAEFDDIVVGSK